MNAFRQPAAQSNPVDDTELFETLMTKRKIAWLTIAFLFGAFALFGFSSYAYITGVLPLFWAIFNNSIAAYMAFTVTHEASHSSVSTNRTLNDWVGRAAMFLMEPTPIFLSFRAIHMNHHKFTNDPARDPDIYAGSGPAWLLPFKWATLDTGYFRFYLQPEIFAKRPKRERFEFYLGIAFGLVVVVAMAAAGWLAYYLLLFFIPSRVLKFILGFSFDFLPHYPHKATAKRQPFQSTSNRVGMEWLLTPLFFYQNYHLVHHLYPTVPFYLYLKVWKAKLKYHKEQNPALVSAFSLKPKP